MATGHYARVEDEYELKERTTALKRKLDVIVETARVLVGRGARFLIEHGLAVRVPPS